MTKFANIGFFALLCTAVSAPQALAQDAGEFMIDTSIARTKLVDEGVVRSDGVVDPEAAYETRETYGSILTLSYFPIDHVALDASISTPITTNNIPAGSLGGLPNLGNDEFVMATIGASFYPFDGPVRPYVGGGLAVQITTQERDGLAVGLDIPSSHGPYVRGGVRAGLGDNFDIFADVRKSWYSTNATGLLPLDATFTNFAEVDADAVLDPLTIQLGIGTRFGHATGGSQTFAPREAGDFTVKLGVTTLRLEDDTELVVAGTLLPGAGVDTFEHQTISAQFSYFVTDHFAANATVGFPPTISIYGAGAIGALPTLGEITYGPTTLTAQWHPVSEGRIRPYIGAGAAYMIVFGTEDGAFSNLEVDNDLGLAFEAGVDFRISDGLGLFVDAKKTFLRPEARGTFDGDDVVGHTTLDPWAFTTGLSISF